MHVKCVLKYGYKSIRRALVRNCKYSGLRLLPYIPDNWAGTEFSRNGKATAGGGGIRDAASAIPYAPAESIGPMLPPRA